MKKLVSIFGWIFVVFTIISVVFTLLTTYQFIYIKYFSGYYPIQIGIFLTMISWALKFWIYDKDDKKITYSLICLFLAAIALFFRLFVVF